MGERFYTQQMQEIATIAIDSMVKMQPTTVQCPHCAVGQMFPDQEQCDICTINADKEYIKSWEDRLDPDIHADLERS